MVFSNYRRFHGLRKRIRIAGGRNDPMSILISGAIFSVVIVLAIIASPFVLVGVGVVFFTTSGERQKAINTFNSDLKTWTLESYDEFKTWFSSTSIRYTFDNGTLINEVLTPTSISSINFQSLSHLEDNPPINTNFSSFYYKAQLDYEDVELDFDSSAYTRLVLVINGIPESQISTIKTFKKTSYDCKCVVENCDSDDPVYCFTICGTCYTRYYLKSICYIIEQSGRLEECYRGNGVTYSSNPGSTTNSDSNYGRNLTVDLQIRHKDDPELLLHSVTGGDNDFGLSKNEKVLIGSIFSSLGGIGIFIEVLICICVPVVGIILVMSILNKKLKMLKRLIKKEKKLECLSTYIPKIEKPVEMKKIAPINAHSTNINNNVVYKTKIVQETEIKDNEENTPSTITAESFVPEAEDVMGIDYSSTLDPRDNMILDPISYPSVDNSFLNSFNEY